ncbi:iron ABC transporter permease [Pseudonocardia nigra]|uniref:iron ABC transporter permease n=1 Tax=Pseudonocardia nigra TaxID=1921578 RepID=UPI001C607691|nr:iron ABC transporter permease [Pseudonocardia nigra]
MTQVHPTARQAPPVAPAVALAEPVAKGRLALVALAGALAVVLLAAVHVTQGTADVDAADLWRLALGGGTDQAAAVVIASRIPRLLAGVLVGVALGAAGAALQSIARNTLASPDTLGVNAGAFLAVVTAAAFGISLPIFASGALAFLGGLLAAGLVLALSSGAGAGPTRLVLAGSAISLALYALVTVLLLLFAQETTGLYAWGSGALGQIGLDAVTRMGPVVLLAVAGLLLLARRLDILGLGDDTAAVLGMPVRRTRLLVVLLAVLLSAAAVTVAGPVAFVGLCAPALVRLVASRVPGLHRHRALVPVSAVAGVLVVLGADVLVRFALGANAGVEVPTGVITTVFGAVVLVALAYRFRDSGPVREAPAARPGRLRTRRAFTLVACTSLALTVAAAVAGMLLGDALLLTGDVANWVAGRSGPVVTYVLDARFPRVLAALLAGGALAVAGTAVQAVCRNPLAEPGLLGVSGGAGIGAVLVITVVPAAGIWMITGAAGLGALVACALVFGLAARGWLASDRLVLIGVGVSHGAMAVITVLIVLTDPWNSTKALTWLSGSTYGRTLPQLLPVAVALLLTVPVLVGARGELDVMALDEDTPRVLGIRLGPTRLLLLGLAALLTATAVAAVGVISFVGLVAPHAARALVGSRHARALPVAALLGGLLVCLADILGRTVIAPAQLPAGLLTAVVGTPYFVWLLWRSRTGSR